VDAFGRLAQPSTIDQVMGREGDLVLVLESSGVMRLGGWWAGSRWEQAVEELAAEVFGGGVVAHLEGQQRLGQLLQVGEVLWLEHLALDDGEVDLHLVQPGGANR
jgi:hypothetical protein